MGEDRPDYESSTNIEAQSLDQLDINITGQGLGNVDINVSGQDVGVSTAGEFASESGDLVVKAETLTVPANDQDSTDLITSTAAARTIIEQAFAWSESGYDPDIYVELQQIDPPTNPLDELGAHLGGYPIAFDPGWASPGEFVIVARVVNPTSSSIDVTVAATTRDV